MTGQLDNGVDGKGGPLRRSSPRHQQRRLLVRFRQRAVGKRGRRSHSAHRRQQLITRASPDGNSQNPSAASRDDLDHAAKKSRAALLKAHLAVLPAILPPRLAPNPARRHSKRRPANSPTNQTGQPGRRRPKPRRALFQFWPLLVDFLITSGGFPANLQGSGRRKNSHPLDRRLAPGCQRADELLAGGSLRPLGPRPALICPG